MLEETMVETSPEFTADLAATFAEPSNGTGADVTAAPDAAVTPAIETEKPAMPGPPQDKAAAPVTAKEPVKEAAPTEPEELDDEDVGEPKVVEYKGKNEWHFPEAKGRVLMANHKFAREIREAVPDITVDGVKAAYAADTSLKRLVNDYLYGNVEGIVQDFARTAQESRNPQAFTEFAVSAAKSLAQASPEAYIKEIAQPAISTYLDAFQHRLIQDLKTAEQSGDEGNVKAARYALFKAQNESYQLTGRYIRPEDIGAPDPFAQRATELDAQEQRIRETVQAQQQREATAWSNQFEQQKNSRVEGAIDKVLEKVKDQYAQNPATLKAWKTYLSKQIEDRMKADPDFVARFDIDRQAAARTRSARDMEAALSRWVSRAEGIIRAEARQLIPQATAAVMKQSQEQHRALANGAQRQEPRGSGSPIPKSIVTPPGKSGDMVDFKRELDEAFAS